MSRTNRDNLFPYLFITLALTWIIGFIPIILGLGGTGFGDILFKLLAGPAPSVVAILFVLFTYTKKQKIDYFRRAFDIRQMGFKWPLLTMVFFAVMSGPFNEEFGWRGYALDRLIARYGFWTGSAILGFIWGIWHLPWYFYPGNGQYIAWQASPIHGIMFIVMSITLSCIVSIVYIKTKRSIIAGAFVHMIANFFTGSILIYPFDSTYIITVFYLATVLEGLVILYFIKSKAFKIKYLEHILPKTN